MFFSKLGFSLLAAGYAVAAPVVSSPIGARGIEDHWIMVMKDTMQDDLSTWLGGKDLPVQQGVKHTYQIGSFKAFSGNYTPSVMDILHNMAEIAYIEPDTVVKSSALTTQSGAPWGLGRISHKAKGSTDYIYDDTAGAGTYSYIIDTGIYTQHEEFQGRATFAANFAGDGKDSDGNGHGTHVAGTVGSNKYGVAKKTNLIAVKVLDSDGSGSNSGVIKGIEFATSDMKAKNRTGKAVANMSLGGTFSQATNDAVKAATDAGLFMGVAAGNDGALASGTSPASEPSACTVGATDKDDNEASYSNYGSAVDIFAPGTAILSTWNRNTTDTNTISGTSMATPHIVGLAAYLIGRDGASTPAALCQKIKDTSTQGAISRGFLPSLSGTPNSLANNGNGK